MTAETTAPEDKRRARFPIFRPLGDRALTVSFGDSIDAETNETVIRIADSLREHPFDGFAEAVPTYCALLIIYDPLVISGDDVEHLVAARISEARHQARARRRWTVPVHYGGPAALDLDSLAAEKDMTPQELIALHSGAEYRVYMIGFAPGFTYLGGLPERLHAPRLPQPRQMIPAGAIGIGGQQASVNSVAGPSGWRFIGSTPVRAFDPARKAPFLFAAGDLVRFHPVAAAEAAELSARVAQGDTVIRPEQVA